MTAGRKNPQPADTDQGSPRTVGNGTSRSIPGARRSRQGRGTSQPLDINDALAAAIIIVVSLYLAIHGLAWLLR